jgi:hypothetical protein
MGRAGRPAKEPRRTGISRACDDERRGQERAKKKKRAEEGERKKAKGGGRRRRRPPAAAAAARPPGQRVVVLGSDDAGRAAKDRDEVAPEDGKMLPARGTSRLCPKCVVCGRIATMMSSRGGRFFNDTDPRQSKQR